MRSGKLIYPIVFCEAVKSESNFEGETVNYVDKIRTRADVIYNNGRKTIDSGEIFTDYGLTFVVWMYHDIKSDMIIKFEDRIYSIENIKPDRHRKIKEITTRVINE